MNSKKIAFGGIATALSIIILYFTNIIPINTLAILTLTSLIIPSVIILTDLRTGIITFIATSLIGYFIVPINYLLMYSMFFGIYGIVKAFIEKINNMAVEIILKVLYFNVALFSGYFLLGLFIGEIVVNIPLWMAFLGAEVVFIVYDYFLTKFISIFIANKDKYIKQ